MAASRKTKEHNKEYDDGALVVEVIGHARVDLGAAIDFSAMAIPLRPLDPATFNIAIDLPVRVRVRRRNDGAVRVNNDGQLQQWSLRSDRSSENRLILMLVDGVGLGCGVDIEIFSAVPPCSGLGGSSILAACLCAALAALTEPEFTLDESRKRDMVTFATQAEVASGQSLAGGQDACAAMYGHAHLWLWHPDRVEWFTARRALSTATEHVLESHLVVGFAEPHVSQDTNRQQIASMDTAAGRKAWKAVLAAVHGFEKAVAARDWDAAMRRMRTEYRMHREAVPIWVSDKAAELVAACEGLGGAATVCGGGGGGSVWALIEPARRQMLYERWRDMLQSSRGSRVWKPRIAPGMSIVVEKLVARGGRMAVGTTP